MTRVLLVHYTTPPVVGGVERVLARHARLLAGEGFDARVVTGRGGPVGRGVRFHRLPRLDSRHRRVLAVTRELEAGRVTPAFHGLVAQIREDLRPELEGVDVCIVHNALVLHKNLALTAALHQLAPRGSTRLVAWCHDLAPQADRVCAPRGRRTGPPGARRPAADHRPPGRPHPRKPAVPR